MTTKERLKKMLTDHGMFDNQADAVLEEAIPKIEGATPDYQVTWDRSADEYPEALYGVMWLYLKDAALKWIDKNASHAWFRPMFE